MIIKNSLLLTLLSIFFFTACIELPTKPGGPYNPFDPANPNYIQPSVSFTGGPAENAIVTTDVVTFQWQGNRENMEYRYAMDSSAWTEYSSNNVATLTTLMNMLITF